MAVAGKGETLEAIRPPDAADRRAAAVTLVVCCSALFMVTLDNTILNVALPSLQRELHAGTSGLQWTVDAYVLARAGVLFSCGALSDRFGRRRMFRTGLIGFTAASAACGLAPTLGVLIAFRAVQAVCGALMTPASLAIVAGTYTDPVARGRALGVWSATTGLSTAAGPIVGGLLLSEFSWRSVFWVNVPIGAVALIGTRRLRESRAGRRRPLDLIGQTLIAATFGCLTYGLIQAPDDGWTSPGILLLMALAVVSAAVFVVVESRRRSPLLNLGYFRNPQLSGAVVLAIVAFLALGGFTFYNTLYLQEVRGFSPLHAGLLTLPQTAMALVFAPLAGRITGTRGARPPAVAACSLVTVAMLLLAGVVSPATAVPVLLAAYLVLGCGMGLMNPPITNSAVSGMPPDQAGVASATTSTARQIGTNLGVALVGSVVFSTMPARAGATGRLGPALASPYTDGLTSGYLLVAGLAAACVPLAWRAFRR